MQATAWWETILEHVKLQESGLGVNLLAHVSWFSITYLNLWYLARVVEKSDWAHITSSQSLINYQTSQDQQPHLGETSFPNELDMSQMNESSTHYSGAQSLGMRLHSKQNKIAVLVKCSISAIKEADLGEITSIYIVA